MATAKVKTQLSPEQLQAEETALATKISNFIVLIALYFFKDKAKAFLEAIMQGLAAADETQEVTMTDIIDAGADIDSELAELEGNPVWIELATLFKTAMDKIKAGTFGLLDMIKDGAALFNVVKEAKKEAAAAPAQTGN